MRWKNFLKNSQKHNTNEIEDKLEFVFLPKGSLYTLLLTKINQKIGIKKTVTNTE